MIYCSALLTAKVIQAEGKKIYISKDISIYGVPRDRDLKRKWISALKEESVKVCHLNFDENCFERDLKV